MFVQNRVLKRFALAQYRLLARSVFFLGGSPIFVVSLPKAGTHLLTSVLGCMPRVMQSRLHLRLPEFHDPQIPYSRPRDFQPDRSKVLAALGQVRNGQVATSHFPFSRVVGDALKEKGFRVIFAIRDPRDIAISQVNYISNLARHPLHKLFTERYQSFDDRLMACLHGIRDVDQHRVAHQLQFIDRDLPGLPERADAFKGWLTAHGVLTVRFEDLVGARGGGTEERKRNTIAAIADHVNKPLSEAQLDRLMRVSADTTSATFFSGKAFAWKSKLSPDAIQSANSILAETLATYGYSI